MEKSKEKTAAKQDSFIENLPKLLIDNLFISSALISAFCYYLGWSVNSAYYVQLGFLPSMMNKSVPEILASAWIEIGITCVGVLSLFFMYLIFSRLFYSRLMSLHSLKRPIWGFFILLSLAFLTGLYAFNYSWFIAPVPMILAIALLSLTIFWIASILGQQILLISRQNNQQKNLGLFQYVFPNFFVYLVFLILASIFVLNRFSIMRGSILAIDIMNSDKLPTVVIYTEKPLSVQGRYDSSSKLYIYENFKLVDINEKSIFAFITKNSLAKPDDRINKYIFYLSRFDFNYNRSAAIESFVIPRDQVFMFKVQ